MGQVIDPRPKDETLVQFNPDHAVAGPLDFIAAAVAGSAGNQAAKRNGRAGLAAASVA